MMHSSIKGESNVSDAILSIFLFPVQVTYRSSVHHQIPRKDIVTQSDVNMLICYHSNDLSQNYLYMRFFIKMWFLSSYYKLVQTFIHLLLELMVEASDYSPSMPVYTCLLFYAVNNKNRASPEPVMPKFSRDIFCVTAYALSSVASGFTLVEMATKIYKVWPDSIILTQNTIISTSTSSNLIQ